MRPSTNVDENVISPGLGVGVIQALLLLGQVCTKNWMRILQALYGEW